MSNFMTDVALWQSVNDSFSSRLSDICAQARQDPDPEACPEWEYKISAAVGSYQRGLTSHLDHPSFATYVRPMAPVQQFINSIPSWGQTDNLSWTLQKQALDAQTAANASQATIQTYTQAMDMERIAKQSEGTPSELMQAISGTAEAARTAMGKSLKALHTHGSVGSYLLCANLVEKPGWLEGKSETLGQDLDPKYFF